MFAYLQPSPPGSQDHPQATIAFTPPNVAADWLLDKLGNVIRFLPVQDYVDSLNQASVDAMNKAFDALKPVTDILDNIVAALGPPIVSALLTGNLERMIATVIELVSFTVLLLCDLCINDKTRDGRAQFQVRWIVSGFKGASVPLLAATAFAQFCHLFSFSGHYCQPTWAILHRKV